MKSEKYNEVLFHHAQDSTFNNAKFLRQNETDAEKLLWKNLRNNRLGGYKFRRQHPVSTFVADFYCAEKKLIVELDDSVHNLIENKDYDKLRSMVLKENGIEVIRFDNEEVLSSMNEVLSKILKVLESR